MAAMAAQTHATLQTHHLHQPSLRLYSRDTHSWQQDPWKASGSLAAPSHLDVGDGGSSYPSAAQQQYAIPIRSAAYYRREAGQTSSRLDSSEHLLRRKTPCGTLYGGYDGASVERSSKPHAMKHLLLQTPLTTASESSMALNPSASVSVHSGQQPTQQNRPFDPPWPQSEPGYGKLNVNPASWGAAAGSLQPTFVPAQVDSATHMSHTRWAQCQYVNNAAFVPTVLQPSFQTPLGPIAPFELSGYGYPYPDHYLHTYRALEYDELTTSVPSNASVDPLSAWNAARAPVNLLRNGNELEKFNCPAEVPQQMSARAAVAPLLDGTYYNQHKDTNADLFGNINPYLNHQPPSFQDVHYYSDSHVKDFSNDSLPSHQTGFQAFAKEKPGVPDLLYSSNIEYPQPNPQSVLSWAQSVYTDLVQAIQQARSTPAQRASFHKQHPNLRRVNILPEANSRQRLNAGSSQYAAVNDNTTKIGSESARLNGSASFQRPNGELHPSYDDAAVSGLSNPSQIVHPLPDSGGNSSNAYKQLTESAQQSSRLPQPYVPAQKITQLSNLGDIRSSNLSSNDPTLYNNALQVREALAGLCRSSAMRWIDGMLISGCLAYIMGDFQEATDWYHKILELHPRHVEAVSNLAAVHLALDHRRQAEEHWRLAVRLKPDYFEAAEHLVGLLCFEQRDKEAVTVVEEIQSSLWGRESHQDHRYTSSRADNGRLIGLIHAKGNIHYSVQNHAGAAQAFEEAVLVAVGQSKGGISQLIHSIISVLTTQEAYDAGTTVPELNPKLPLLLTPQKALRTASLVFSPSGLLPGLRHIQSDFARKAAVSITSNSLLSLAKIYQDGMAASNSGGATLRPPYGVRDILALYYLSLSLQPSPSTANNVGILLASVQQSALPRLKVDAEDGGELNFPGIAPGSGVHLALTYYRYGLGLDSRHAHLLTNLGSLLKDIGQLSMAIKMYEKAVACDGTFDIALANLANAVKDQGKTGEAITYYRKAVQVNPNFAEAVCGLANALNSICNWAGRGGIVVKGAAFDRWHVDEQGKLVDSRTSTNSGSGWIRKVVDIVENQLSDGEAWGRNTLQEEYIELLFKQLGVHFWDRSSSVRFYKTLQKMFESWAGQSWEGARVVRLIERAIKRISWQWYHDRYVKLRERPLATYNRPQLPSSLTMPGAPTVLPFHTFTFPMTAKQIRLISQRNGLRVSFSALRAPWLPRTVYPPPPPPNPYLNVAYVSSDFNNHPLAHLMQSVFSMHDRGRVRAFCYATTQSDDSVYRRKIEAEAPVFRNASSWSTEQLVQQIVDDGIHILVNLNGYTRGAKNEVFAARPAPIQMSFMGFAGTMGAEWCDYLLADDVAIPPSTLRPYRQNVTIEDLSYDGNSTSFPPSPTSSKFRSESNDEWVYAENIIYTRDTFFCCDHAQSASPASEQQTTWSQELSRRWKMRKELFPNLPDNAVIFGNFNQLYKIDPTTFRTWLKILSRLPNAYLWLLRFPDLGEAQLRATALSWSTPEIGSRILFTDVAPKGTHIARACVADLFLDTPECNAHTTAADCLWSGTPLLTLPRYEWKMCSRMAASILGGALNKDDDELGRKAWEELVVASEDEYEDTAVRLGRELRYDFTGNATNEVPSTKGRLVELRHLIWSRRWNCKLFNTKRWVSDLEDGFEEAWRRWVSGDGGDIFLKDMPRREPQTNQELGKNMQQQQSTMVATPNVVRQQQRQQQHPPQERFVQPQVPQYPRMQVHQDAQTQLQHPRPHVLQQQQQQQQQQRRFAQPLLYQSPYAALY